MTYDTINTVPSTLSALKAALRERGIFPKKRLGQNFLIDQNILRLIVKTAAISERDIILEIGTGAGSLTKLLGERAHEVLGVEIDRGLFNLSWEVLTPYKNIHLINMDVLKSKTAIDPRVEEILKGWLQSNRGLTLKVVSNLPYSISTPAIIAILEGELPVELMVLTLQKEIVDRLAARPGTKEYGVLSIIAQLFAEIHIVRTLPAKVFWPVPQVESAIVVLNVDKEKAHKIVPDYRLFSTIVRAVFQSRRKTLLNSLFMLNLPFINGNKETLSAVFNRLGIKPLLRGEALDLEGFTALTGEISNLIKGKTNG